MRFDRNISRSAALVRLPLFGEPACLPFCVTTCPAFYRKVFPDGDDELVYYKTSPQTCKRLQVVSIVNTRSDPGEDVVCMYVCSKVFLHTQ